MNWFQQLNEVMKQIVNIIICVSFTFVIWVTFIGVVNTMFDFKPAGLDRGRIKIIFYIAGFMISVFLSVKIVFG